MKAIRVPLAVAACFLLAPKLQAQVNVRIEVLQRAKDAVQSTDCARDATPNETPQSLNPIDDAKAPNVPGCEATVNNASENGPSGQAALDSLPYKYVGNTFSLKFHRPTCPFAILISKRHTRHFHFRKEAVEDNFTPCNYCLPQNWLTVHAVILATGHAQANTPADSQPRAAQAP